MSAMGPPPYIIASAKIAATTPPTILSGSGVFDPVRGGAGLYTLSLSQPIDVSDRSVVASAAATAGTIVIVGESLGTDTTITIAITNSDDVPVPVDVNFSVVVVRNS